MASDRGEFPWPRLLNIHLAARFLSVGTDTVRDWIHAGVLSPVPLPGSALRERGGRVVLGPRDRRLNKICLDIRDLNKMIDRLKAEGE